MAISSNLACNVVCVGEAGGGGGIHNQADSLLTNSEKLLQRQTHLQILQPGFQLRFSDRVAVNRLQPASVRPEGNGVNGRSRKCL